MRKSIKAMGIMALMVMVAFTLSAFTKVNNNSVEAVESEYTCNVEIFKPNGNHFVKGNITVYFGGRGEGGWAKYWVDNNGKSTISWSSKRGEYIKRITFDELLESGYYEIDDIKLVDGKTYKLTAKKK